jgi:hypothetical protein
VSEWTEVPRSLGDCEGERVDVTLRHRAQVFDIDEIGCKLTAAVPATGAYAGPP